ncbi:MAG: hypothetical protein P8R54_11635 [Myxococcota bacterium]|nr:hypothetical protein [Myxococcota bacterium]
MWLFLISAALAHPFESKLYGHQTTLWLTADSATVEYAVEVPTANLLAEIRASLSGAPTQAAQDAFNSQLHRTLRDALRLLVDGEAVVWEQAEPAEDSGRGDVKFIVYRLALKAALPSGARTLQLIDGNYPDEPSIFQTSVLLDGSLILDASSQLTVLDGRLTGSRDGLWRPEESNRELRLSFRRRDGAALWAQLSALGGQEPGFRPSAEVLSGIPVEAAASLRSGRLPVTWVVVLLVLSVVLGGIGGRRRSALVVGGLLCSGVAVVGLFGLAGVLLAGLLIAAAVAAVVGRSGRPAS